MSSKEIKRIILDPTSDVYEIDKCFDIDFINTITGVYDSLFVLFKNYSKNIDRINMLIDVLDGISMHKGDKVLNHMIKCSISLNTKIVNNFKAKERSKMHSSLMKIDSVVNKINEHKRNEVNNNLVLLENLIFNVRDIEVIKRFISGAKNLFKYKSVNGEDIFSELLNHYVDSDIDNDLDYFYKVIMMFVRNDKFYSDGNVEKYKEILINNKDKQHVRDVLSIIDGVNVSFDKFSDKYDVMFDIPNFVYDEVSKFKYDVDGRVMFTNQECITIDGEDDRCLDDALYLEKNLDGTYTLYIHIIDVPSFIPYYSYTNEEARHREETLYLCDRSVLLYPDEISNNYCSILPGVSRNAISYVVDLDRNMNVIEDSFMIFKSVIINKHKMSYKEADTRLEIGSTDVDNMLRNLLMFAYRQKANNLDKDKYREYKSNLNGDSFKCGLNIDKMSYNSCAIIEEAMVLVNYLVAKRFKEQGLPYIYRVFSVPDEDYIKSKIMEFTLRSDVLCYDEALIKEYKNTLVRASYSHQALPHDGVNCICYSHSSAPARRYSDSYCQYLIHDLIFERKLDDSHVYGWEDRNKMLVRYLNEKRVNNSLFASQYNYDKLVRNRTRK